MKQRVIWMMMAAACVILGAVSVFIYISKDHTPPEISIEKQDITYTEGDSYEGLMEGVTATDNIDGDLTDQVFVDRIIVTGEDTAVVYYGVTDKEQNVATKGRKITYHSGESSADDAAQEAEEEEQQAEEEAKKAVEEAAQQEAAAQEQAEEQQTELTPDGANPAIALTSDSATITAGTTFDPMSVVQGMVDDKDNVDVLSRQVMVDGTYDTSVPGSYALSFSVKDSDGNVSAPVAFTLVVQ